MKVSSGILVMAMIGAVTAQRSLAGQSDWDRPAAARYLDDRINLWFVRATQLRAGEGKVTCVSCHTVVPYLLARPALRKAMQITEPTSQETRLLDNVTRRASFQGKAGFSGDQRKCSHQQSHLSEVRLRDCHRDPPAP